MAMPEQCLSNSPTKGTERARWNGNDFIKKMMTCQIHPSKTLRVELTENLVVNIKGALQALRLKRTKQCSDE